MLDIFLPKKGLHLAVRDDNVRLRLTPEGDRIYVSGGHCRLAARLYKTTLELGATYKRLVGYGWTVADIAAKTGKSAASVNAALDLQGAPPEVQRLVASGRVSPTLAAQTVKRDGELATAVLANAVDHAAQRGKERATLRISQGLWVFSLPSYAAFRCVCRRLARGSQTGGLPW